MSLNLFYIPQLCLLESVLILDKKKLPKVSINWQQLLYLTYNLGRNLKMSEDKGVTLFVLVYVEIDKLQGKNDFVPAHFDQRLICKLRRQWCWNSSLDINDASKLDISGANMQT